MSSNNAITYKDLIFTKHAYERMRNRSVSFDNIYQTIKYPENKKSDGADKTKFIKNIKQRQHQVVAKYLADEKRWLVISVWVRGEEDKVPLMWQLITLPFRLIRKLLSTFFR